MTADIIKLDINQVKNENVFYTLAHMHVLYLSTVT